MAQSIIEQCEVFVNSPSVKYVNGYMEADYEYRTNNVQFENNKYMIFPKVEKLNIKTNLNVSKTGLMLIGWGGNNGTTLTGALLANNYGFQWRSKTGIKSANWYGSITQASTMRLGNDQNGKDIYVPLNKVLPMVSPNDIVIDGWDISNMNLADAMERACVFDYEIQFQLRPLMVKMKPRRGIYDPKFIAANQSDRVNNALSGTKWEQCQQIINDIKEFKETNCLDKVVIVWTANTERFANIIEGVNDTYDNLKKAIENNHSEISPSTLFAFAAISTKSIYINGSPQNTFVPGLINMAEQMGSFIAGDDFKSGQTKIKSVLMDFLVTAGIKPISIVSYNHLGNNDGKNLSEPLQFRSKEISKTNVVDDMVNSNKVLYKDGEKPDHCVVIKYIPSVGDSKRAMDEYTSEIMMHGHNTLVIHNTCEDSLLAAPIILDLVLIAELCTRIEFKKSYETSDKYQSFHPILSILSYLCKAPLVPNNTPVVNALAKQRACIENIFRACLGLAPENFMALEHKILTLMNEDKEKTHFMDTNGTSNGYHL